MRLPGAGFHAPAPPALLPHSFPQTTSQMIDETAVYGLIGEDGFTRLVAAFYRQIPDDEILGPMYRMVEDDLANAETRLRDFLIYRFGGPQRYLAVRGAPRLRMRHAPFVIDQAARDRWVQLMERAFQEADLPEEAVAVLWPFLQATATFLMNHPGPAGMNH